jgi:hypothetical protein
LGDVNPVGKRYIKKMLNLDTQLFDDQLFPDFKNKDNIIWNLNMTFDKVISIRLVNATLHNNTTTSDILTPYFFLSLNEHIHNTSSNLVSMMPNGFIDNNLFAKLVLDKVSNEYTLPKECEFIREYFGGVNINRLTISLLRNNGKIANFNQHYNLLFELILLYTP